MAEVRHILSRVWTRIVEFDVDRSFESGPPQKVAAAEIVLGKGWSLFTFDFKRNAAVFLRAASLGDFSKAPFVYNLQFEQATEIAVVPFNELLTATENLPDIPKLIQFFSTGHCGSTLLHHAFNRVSGVCCISEPIAFNALALNSDGVDDAMKRQLARSALRLLALFAGAETARLIVVKHFSQSTAQLKLLSKAQPQSQNLFLYRDALGWTNSAYHFVQKYGTAMAVTKDQRSLLWRLLSGGMPENYLDGIFDLHAEGLSFDRLAAAAWATQIQHYNEAVQQGVSLYPLRYNELIAGREAAMGHLFQSFGLPADAVAATLSVFDKDAHEGTRSARSKDDLHFSDDNYAVVKAVLLHPRIALDSQMTLTAS
jgi:hypothetical protein